MLTEAGARLGVSPALKASRLCEEEVALSADGSRSEAVPRLELFDLSGAYRLGGVARPDATLRSAEMPRLDPGFVRSEELLRPDEAFN